MDIIIADQHGKEKAFLTDYESLDIEVNDFGEKGNDNTGNTFELKMDRKTSEKYSLGIYDYIFCPGTEYGGIIEGTQVITNSEEVIWFGTTFRGLMSQCIYTRRTIWRRNEELNSVLKKIMSNGTDACNLFQVSDEDSGIIVKRPWTGKYYKKSELIFRTLKNLKPSRRIEIKTIQGGVNEPFQLELTTKEVQNYEEELQYSQDNKIPATITNDKTGITHLIALNKKKNGNIETLNIWLDYKGDAVIGNDPGDFPGIKSKTSFVEFTSSLEEPEDEVVEEIEVEKDFLEKALAEFDKLKHKMSMKINEVGDINAEIGDIISGHDLTTNLSISEPIVGKIIRFEKNGSVSIETKTEGSKQ